MTVLLRPLLIWLVMFTALPANSAKPDFSAPALSAALTAFSQEAYMGHPRLFKGQSDFAGIAAAASSERIVGLKAMEGYLHRNSVRSTDISFLTTDSGSANLVSVNNWFKQERVLEGMAESALAWYLTRDTWYLDELRARATIFSTLIMGNQCKGEPTKTRAYAWYFSLAYDFAVPALTLQEQTLFKDVIKACVGSSLDAVVRAVAADPKNGIAFHALGKFVGSLLIVLRDVPEAQGWLTPALQTYVANLSPWGGVDGGYANGTSYAHWDSGESLLIWDLLDRVLGVPIYQKPWIAELPRFIAYTLPPGTPSGVFGDGAEVNRKEEWPRFGKALMSRYGTPLARWYEKQLFGDDPARLNNLLSPRIPAEAAYWPVGEPDSHLFPSVGWAALHSSMADRSRVSVYFKSSPYGSLNHSHADQNSFVVYARGQVLAMDSGYYDYYNSPHWRDWYKQTRAHNAITFDGGSGQSLGANGLGSNVYAGKITKFITKAEYDVVTGDATIAYEGKVSFAMRTLVFFRPSTLVVIDRLQSVQPRQWEWNLHTTVPLVVSGQGYKLTLNDAEMCVRVAAPELLSQQTESGYAPMPQVTTPVGPHDWNRFSSLSPKSSGLFVSVLRMDCTAPEPRITFSGDGATVELGSRIISVTTNDVLVR